MCDAEWGGLQPQQCAIGHGIGGIDIPAKWCDSLKACCRSKQRHKLVTRSHSHSNRLMALRSKYVYMLLPICAPFHYANKDSPYAKFPAFLSVRIQGVLVCIQGSVSDGSAIFPWVTIKNHHLQIRWLSKSAWSDFSKNVLLWWY